MYGGRDVPRPQEQTITLKQRIFTDAYLANGGNGTEAARTAGYRGSDNVMAQVARDNLRNPQIAAAVARRVRRSAMEAEEVLALLTEHANATMDDFTSVERRERPVTDPETGETRTHVQETVKVDLVKAKKNGKLHLAKEIKETQWGPQVKLVDTQAAAVQLGKYHGFFTDTVVVKEHAADLASTLVNEAAAVLREYIPDDDDYARAVGALQLRLEGLAGHGRP